MRTHYYKSLVSSQDENLAQSQVDTQQCPDTFIYRTEWTQIVSVTGKAGTGKTKCLHSCIHYAIENHFMSLVATPTGYLVSSCRAVFDDDIDANTIHSSFCIPVHGSSPQVNWALAMYDLIIIDEVSMVPPFFFNHILSTVKQLPTRPILLISDDKYQLPPIATGINCTTNSNGIISNNFKIF